MESVAANPARRGRTPSRRPDPERVQLVRERFEREGQTLASWAEEHGEDARLVYKVLSGERACVSGAGHRIAVKLGIKDGAIMPAAANA